MHIDDQELANRVRDALGKGKTPDFDHVLLRSLARAEARRSRSRAPMWRVAGAFAASAAIVGLVVFTGVKENAKTSPTRTNEMGNALASLADAGPLSSPIQGLVSIAGARSLPSETWLEWKTEPASGSTDDTSIGAYELSPTDFLLTMEIPAWDQAGERNVL